MGAGPNRRCDTVVDPAFFESRTKWPWQAWLVASPMILIVALLALTVPSEPSP